jgi:hypothetical protein
MPKKYVNTILNYDKAIPSLITSQLWGLTPDFKHALINKWNNNLDYSRLYDKQRVEEKRLEIPDYIDKVYQDATNFIDEFPEFRPMIKEVTEE